MTLKQIVTAATVSAIAAGSLIPLASAANAGDWDHHGRRAHAESYAFSNSGGRGVWGEHRPNEHMRGGDRDFDRDYDYGYRRHRNHEGRNLAIGAFAAIMGLALAAEASKVHNNYYDERD